MDPQTGTLQVNEQAGVINAAFFGSVMIQPDPGFCISQRTVGKVVTDAGHACTEHVTQNIFSGTSGT
jgi:hypothetical protein